MINPDVQALIDLQAEDDLVEEIVAQLDAIAPRLAALDSVRAAAAKAIQQLRAAVEADDRKRTELGLRLTEHKERHDKNVAQVDLVKRMREATAAVAQVEMGKKVLLELEQSHRDVLNRATEGRKVLAEKEAALDNLDVQQVAARDAIKAEQAALGGTLQAAQAKRAARAESVSGPMRAKYDRIRQRRKSQSLFAIESGACSACDTAIPVQRRQAMSNSGSVEVCEGCGVLIFAKEG
jgi:predicted  nucleic acid-binding Zn-ribbon protein